MTAIAAPAPRTAPDSKGRDALALTYQRLMLIMLLFMGVTVLIAARLIYLEIFADRSTVAARDPLIPVRADITDRNGVPLARTFDAWSIGIHPNKLLGSPDDLAPKLAAMFPERTEAQYRAILKSDKNFVYLKRRAVPEQVAAVNALGEPAIAFDREPERLYPQTGLAAHVLGWTDFDGRGVAGVERVLNDRLSDPAKRGQPVALSIDSRVQAAMESELGAAVTKHSAEGGAGIVMDVRTGEIIAMASFPTFNPNAAGQSPPDAQYNRATMGVYELGSVFKPLTIAAAIDAGVITSMSRRWHSGIPVTIGRFSITDYKGENRPLSVPEVLVYSSNTATARIADEMGMERMQKSFRALGFDQAAHIELAEKSKPLWPREWGRATVLTAGFGHGVAITPLHLASAYSALVNGGIWRPATVYKTTNPPKGRRVYSESTSARMRGLLRMVVLEGSGKNANAAGYRVGGKTGTAEKTSAGGYQKRTNVSTFASAFPMDDPRYVVIAMLDAPKATPDTHGYTTAGWVSAPIVKKVIDRAAPSLGIAPSDTRDVDVSELRPLVRVKGK
ncbi:peptidoglycan D,D-transpeptidase FtsI family protein [Allosphingosinicella indica]|uniref:Cell division protein FtsI (Penicillin-binding protein 3) n=1 Tax=Allosphingosinicella indica TaxID=941907 RepID=A0A1X7FZZ5_9SPHN|nr:penicillin-binding protein 2 [Allosphingosinicella indica]SMF61672.1 cell division protein FtsI (penicillin-binding protein 3) [Allosphingosinicella indica]